MRTIPGTCMLVALLLLAPTAAPAAAASDDDPTRTLAFRNLQQLVRQEERVLEHARQSDGRYNVEQVQQGFQDLVREYEVFLADNPDYAPGYVAYGLMLDRAGETRIASRMFMRADELDPEIPVVQNQLGNYMVENERPVNALPYFLKAIELEPEEPLYYYQLGNLLAEYRHAFLEREMYEPEVLDEQMQEAFRKAVRHGSGEVAYAYRYAESYYDLGEPDWEGALEAWRTLESELRPGIERQTVQLQRANIHLLRGEPKAAAALLEGITAPALQSNKASLLERIP